MKKILSIVALCLIAVIAGVIIVFAVVDKNYNPNLLAPDYIQICINEENIFYPIDFRLHLRIMYGRTWQWKIFCCPRKPQVRKGWRCENSYH